MVELTLVFPFLLFVLFGVFEFGLMMYSMGSSRWAAAEGARVVSEIGSQRQKCSLVAGCVSTYGISNTNNPCDADCQAISTINLGPLGVTSIAAIDEIDIQKLTVSSSGALSPDTATPCPCENRYALNGAAISSTYPSDDCKTVPAGSACRNVTLGQADYVSVRIKFHYPWKTGIFTRFPVPNMTATYDVRLEPQRFPGS